MSPSVAGEEEFNQYIINKKVRFITKLGPRGTAESPNGGGQDK